jgi:hypothetical protein
MIALAVGHSDVTSFLPVMSQLQLLAGIIVDVT